MSIKHILTLSLLLSVEQPVSSAELTPASRAVATTALNTDQQSWLHQASRQEHEGWIYLHLQGPPRQRGFQHGYLLAEEIRSSLTAAKKVWQYESGLEWTWLVEQASQLWKGKIDAENLAEIDGIAEGLKAAGFVTARDELIAFNGIIELASYWWPLEKERQNSRAPTRPRESCSAFIATGSMTADGGIVMGHNTMGGYEDNDCNIVFDLVPEQGHRILMQGYPGWIHSGTDFFLTDAGLVGTETTIGGFRGFDERGIPEFVRMRRATQDAATIDEWCRIMRAGNNGGYANAWLLGDVNTGEIARLELGLKQVAFEKKKDGYFIGSNVAEDLKLLRQETSIRETDVRLSSIARRVRWKQLMHQYAGKIDLELAKKFEADHYDMFLEQEHAGGRSLCSHGDLEREPSGSTVPFAPSGTLDGKVVDTRLAKQMAFVGRWGSSCGIAFDAPAFLEAHPQFDWMADILKSRPSRPWVVFRAAEVSHDAAVNP